ncbi:24147_t:CDS:1, partial [Racocetra persica]
MVMANIPLKKVNYLRPFLQKYCHEGGSIPQAPTLRQVYLPDIFDDHILKLKD